MHRSLNALLLRGLLGTVLSVAAITAAATQAAQFEGRLHFEQGRLMLVEQPGAGAMCLTLARPAALAQRDDSNG